MEEESYPQKPVDDIVAASVHDGQSSQNSFLLVWILISLLLFIAAAVGGYYLASSKSTTPETPAVFPTLAPKPTATPTPLHPEPAEGDPTADWQVYENEELSFKYPSNWSSEDYKIAGVSPDVVIYIIPKDSTLMNECMQVETTDEKDGLVIKKFSRVTVGEMCAGGDPNSREIWVIPTEEAYSSGISYTYSAQDNPEAELIFNQILSTLKFTE